MDLIIREFEKHAVRMIQQDGKVWFIAKDVCTVLGIAKYRDYINSRLEADERMSISVDTHGGKQNMVAVNESGLYALIFQSSKPEANKFRKWVTSEVLPSIRKNGAYVAPNADMAGVINALLEAQEKRIEAKCAELSAVRTENQLLNFFRPVGKPGDVSAKTGEEKWRFRRGYFCSGDRGKHVSLLLQHPDQPDLFETFEVTQ